jgi:hypothetical protein
MIASILLEIALDFQGVSRLIAVDPYPAQT